MEQHNGPKTADPLALSGHPELDKCCERVKSLKECFRISSLINSTLELDEVLENIMTTSRAILRADAASLLLVDDKTDELVFEIAQGPVANQLKSGFRLRKGEGIAGHVFETGKPALIQDAYRDPRFNPDFDRRTGYRTQSILCMPLAIKERVIGVSQVINKLDGAPFNPEDEETLALLCTHAAIAIENARMHKDILRKRQIESDLDFATSIQLSFLPQEIPRIEGLRFHAHYQAALAVGGDFYDFIPLEENRMGVLIGDVSGKGVASALYMAKFTSDFRLLAIREKDPARLVMQVNEILCQRSRQGMFVTLFYMVLSESGRKLAYANAGHLPPLMWNHGHGSYFLLRDCGGPPLGIVSGHEYCTGQVELGPGDCILLATDGLIEAKSPEGDRYGWERLEKAVRAGSSKVEGVYGRISKSMRNFVKDSAQADDTTIVLVGVEE